MNSGFICGIKPEHGETTRGYFLEILLDRDEIGLHLPFSGWFGAECLFGSRLIGGWWMGSGFWFDLVRFRRDFAMCIEN